MGGGVCRKNICYYAATICDSHKFDMQPDHVLKKLNYDFLTLKSDGEGDLRAESLLSCCFIS